MTIPFTGVPLPQHAPFVRRVEDAGYDSFWSAESTHFDGFTPLALAAEHTERVRLVTGIVNVFTRGPAVLAQTAAALAEASNGRFVLGIGTSSNVIVERWNEIPFTRPREKAEQTIAQLRAILSGERGPGGFKLPAPPPPIPIVLAALRGRMLELAAQVADGAFTNFLPLSRVRQVADAFGAPDKELACRFFSFTGEDGLALAKRTFVAYATVPVYSEFFRWLGFGDEIAPLVDAWNAGERARAVELVPEPLVREIFLLGSLEAQRERLEDFGAAGITTGVVALACAPGELERHIDAFAPR